MRVKVTANITVGYGGEYHGEGAELSVLPDDFPQLAGLVEVIESETDELVEDTDEMTVAQLKATLDAQGIKYPRTAKKDDLIALLGE